MLTGVGEEIIWLTHLRAVLYRAFMMPIPSQLTLANWGGGREGGYHSVNSLATFGAFLQYTNNYSDLFDMRATTSYISLYTSVRISANPTSVECFNTIWIHIKLLPVTAILNSLNLKSVMSRTSGKAENLLRCFVVIG